MRDFLGFPYRLTNLHALQGGVAGENGVWQRVHLVAGDVAVGDGN